MNQSAELFNFPIPGASFSIPKIFTLGADIAYEVGVDSTFSGEGVVNFGLTASLPNSASVQADVWNRAGSAVGFDGGPLVEPSFDVKSLSASLQIVTYSQAKVSFGINVVKFGDFDVAVALQIPKVTTTLTAAYGENLSNYGRPR